MAKDRYGHTLLIGDKIKVVAEGNLNTHIKKYNYEGIIQEFSIDQKIAEICFTYLIDEYEYNSYGVIECNCLIKL